MDIDPRGVELIHSEGGGGVGCCLSVCSFNDGSFISAELAVFHEERDAVRKDGLLGRRRQLKLCLQETQRSIKGTANGIFAARRHQTGAGKSPFEAFLLLPVSFSRRRGGEST